MSKVRVYELAKEVGVDNKEVIAQAMKLGIEVDGHLTILEDSAADSIRGFFKSSTGGDVEQKRIRSTVIRRRRSRGGDEAPAAEPVVEATPAPAQAEMAPEPAVAEASAEATVPAEEVKAEPATVEPEAVEAAPEPAPAESATAPEAEASEETVPQVESRRPKRLQVDPNARPTATQAVVVAAPPPGFQIPGRNNPSQGFRGGRPGAGGPPSRGGYDSNRGGYDRDRGPREPREPRPGGNFRGGAGVGGFMPPPGPDPFSSEKTGRRTMRDNKFGEMRGGDSDAERKRKKPGRRIVDQNVQNWNTRMAMDDDMGRRRRRGPKKKRSMGGESSVPKAAKRVVKIDEVITVAEMAQQMSVKASDLIRQLMSNGVMGGLNYNLDFDTAALMAEEYGYTVESVGFEFTDYVPEVEDKEEELIAKAPVVTIMGHVDHGKTSLLDYIRKAKVAAGEAGGITQHIGAYEVDMGEQGAIVFLDTPGHEAFTQMRARGAQVTDIVILVVAADDGVMPQTIEAISHAKAAEVPIIVACNKMDKPNANPDRVLQQLAEHELVPEDWGGNTTVCKVSAHTGEGIDALLEILALQSEILELRANPDKPGTGVVIEAQLDRGRGTVATLLVQDGTVRKGDYVVSGAVYGRVRAMANYRGESVDEAGPATPVELLGLSGLPSVSDPFYVVADEKKARAIVDYRQAKDRQKELGNSARMSLEGLFEQMQAGDVADLNLILKCDVQGSIEALKKSFAKLTHDEVRINIIHSAAGAVTESDVNLANASDAIIIGFNVRPDVNARALAEQEGVQINTYSIIYEAINDVKAAMEGLLTPDIEERDAGHAEVREVFSIPKVGTIAGCMVQDGVIKRGGLARLYRDNVLIWSGNISSLRRFKDDVKEVREGYECGIGLVNYNDLKEGDIIEVYENIEVAKKLD